MRPSSARALLLVVIGEFVWPTGQPAWSSTLLSALSEFGIEPSAGRKALQRIAATGITASGREANRVRWSVTGKGDRILRAGWERTYGWHARDTAWDGRWLVLSVTVPESQRKLRHHLQNDRQPGALAGSFVQREVVSVGVLIIDRCQLRDAAQSHQSQRFDGLLFTSTISREVEQLAAVR